MRVIRFKNKFVEYIPEQLECGVLYISMENNVGVHSCACGCGKEVVTPISPTDWQLKFDGVSITLEPSIGNWAFPCRSHYFIRNGVVTWAGKMSNEAVRYGKDRDKSAKARYFNQNEPTEITKLASDAMKNLAKVEPKDVELSWMDRIKRWFAI